MVLDSAYMPQKFDYEKSGGRLLGRVVGDALLLRDLRTMSTVSYAGVL